MTLELCDGEICGFCPTCGMKIYDCHVDLNIVDFFHCPECNKKYYLSELWECPISNN